MKISVIIPTYKPQDYIWECLTSLSKQSFSTNSYEIIIVLNGCCEPWKTEIETFIRTNLSQNHVKFIQTNQCGVSNARNIALDHAVGEYITFIDDDDHVSPTYIEDLYNVSNISTIGIARPIAYVDNNMVQVPYPITNIFDRFYPAERIPFLRLRRYFIGPCMKMFHRDIIGNRRFNPNFSVGEDGLFMFLVSDKFKKCSLANSRSVYYRRYRAGSLVANRTKEFVQTNNKKLLRETLNIYKSGYERYNFIFFLMQVCSYIKGIIC